MNLLEKVTNHKVFTFFDRITGLIRIDTIKFHHELILSIPSNPVILSLLHESSDQFCVFPLNSFFAHVRRDQL